MKESENSHFEDEEPSIEHEEFPTPEGFKHSGFAINTEEMDTLSRTGRLVIERIGTAGVGDIVTLNDYKGVGGAVYAKVVSVVRTEGPKSNFEFELIGD